MFSKSNTLSHQNFPSGSNDDLNQHFAAIQNCDKLRKNVCDEFKKLGKYLYDLNCIEKRLVDNLTTITTLNNADEQLVRLLKQWSELMEQSAKNRQDRAINNNRTLVEPLKRFQIAFNEIKSAIKRHEQLVGDCQKFGRKLQDCQRGERTSTAIVKQNHYETALKQAQHDRAALAAILRRELPQFLQKRIDYFLPSLAAFISAGILYARSDLDAVCESSVTIDQSRESRLDKQRQLFKAIDNLDIVSTSKEPRRTSMT